MNNSFFYIHQKSSTYVVMKVEQATGMIMGVFILKYLSCPLSHTKRKNDHYSELLVKIHNLKKWKGRLPSFGGKEVLIKSMLQSNILLYFIICGSS